MDTVIVSVSIINLVLITYIIALLKSISNRDYEEKISTAIENLSEKQAEEFSRNRHEYMSYAKDLRQELIDTLSKLSQSNSTSQKNQLDSFALTLKNISDTQLKNLESLNESLKKLKETTSDTLRNEIRYLQQENEKKLEEMRQIVDEKLHSTLEKRLGESFKAVSSQLESVYKGLGEMQNLAANVGDLKRVLTNVKSRGVFGEIQLKNILEDILTRDQFEENVKIGDGNVEFAIKIPSREEGHKHILLPVDAKFPVEDYLKIINEAQQNADPASLTKSVKALGEAIKKAARDIKEKYINPPQTTDFALMFLPVEGLFAEVLRIDGLFEEVRRTYNVVITGPTTFTAILNSLQMGFRTLAVEKHSHKVWKILGEAKREFQNFEEILARTRKKLEEAADNIDRAHKKTQNIGRKLKEVETAPSLEKQNLTGLENSQETDLPGENEDF